MTKSHPLNAIYQKRYREKNKEVRKVKLRIWRRNNPRLTAKTKNRNNYMSKYGITPEEAIQMLERQGNCCAICKKSITLGGKAGAKIDHCHTSGLIRGILCSTCNTGLGHFKDDIPLLLSSIDYLRNFFDGEIYKLIQDIKAPKQFINPFLKKEQEDKAS